MEFRILGALEVLERGVPLDLGGPKQRALLAALLLEPSRVVSSGRLIEALWDEDPPETAHKALQVHVSQLRKLLGRETLVTKAPGYMLRVAADRLDVTKFESLLDEARYREALALWHGPALADFAEEPFARAEAARLEELRVRCVEGRIEQDLAAGLHGELVAELQRLVRDHPARERLRGQLMLALYRAGRQAEALDAYQDARRVLVEELGIEPSARLRELHQAILNQEPGLQVADADDAPSVTAPPAVRLPDEASRREVRKTVTVVHVDVSVTAAGSEPLDPELTRRIARAALPAVETAVLRHGGSLETVSDDAIVAVFGLPVVHEDDALRALRAAADLRVEFGIACAEIAEPQGLRVDARIGVSTGAVVTGQEGERVRTSGDPLRASAELARGADPGDIVLDDATAQLARHSERSTTPRRLHSPMVGRDRERRRIESAFEDAVGDRSCQLFTVVGPAGVGKSRLVAEFLAKLPADARVGRGRCLPYGEGITFWPLLEVVKELVGLDDADSPDEARAKLSRADPSGGSTAQRVAELIGVSEATDAVEEGLEAVQQLFAALAADQPLVLVFDDIHWAEPTFLELVERIADRTRDAPIFLLCLARPELLDIRPGWGGGMLNATAALLEPLSNDECVQLIENLVGGTQLAGGAGRRIADAAEGNPLFVEEMLSMLIDDGVLVRAAGGWVAEQDVATVRVPPTIQALLAARLDRLDANERAVIESAAVVGKVFQESAVVELASGDRRGTVESALVALVRKELVRPDRANLGARTYRFRHQLIRDAAYGAIPKEERAGLHERFARWFEQSSGVRPTEVEEVLGYHLEHAYLYRKELGLLDDGARELARDAAEKLGSAGRRALLRSDAPAGVNLVSRAVALLSPDDPLRVDLVPNLRVVQGLGIELAWADRVLTDAVEAAATSGDRRLAAHALVQRGLLRLFTDSDVTADELTESAERATRVFGELGDELGQARAWRLKAQAHYLGRRAGLCAEASEQALVHSRAARDRFEEREIAEWLAIALFLGPTPAPEAAARCERLRADFADIPLFEAMLLAGESMLVAMQAQLDHAEELRARSRQMMTDLGEWFWIALFWSAFFDLWRDDATAAERELRPGYEALKTLGSKSHFSSLAHALASAVYAQGRYDEAERLTFECEEASRANDVHSHILLRSIRAKVYARRGLHEQAQSLAREAVSYAATTDFLPAHADALLDLGEVLDLAGLTGEARDSVDQAILLYEQKGNVLASARARARRLALA